VLVALAQGLGTPEQMALTPYFQQLLPPEAVVVRQIVAQEILMVVLEAPVVAAVQILAGQPEVLPLLIKDMRVVLIAQELLQETTELLVAGAVLVLLVLPQLQQLFPAMVALVLHPQLQHHP
jgi:hypothetical protein